MFRFFLLESNVSSSISVSSSDSRELLAGNARCICGSPMSVRGTRELLTEEVSIICGSRLSLELTSLRRFIFLTFLYAFLLFQLPLFSQDMTNSHIKQLIQTRQLSKARQELAIAMQGNENDPTLNLYQTELWIIEGEVYYNSGQYKKALEIYQEAARRYPSNPMVKLKYEEMVKKVKNVEDSTKSKPVESIPIQPIGLQGGNGIEANSIPGNNMNSSNSKTDLLLTILCIENFVLIVFLFRRLPKSK